MAKYAHCYRLLRVVAPHFVAGAIWRLELNGWECIEAAPILGWMVGKKGSEVVDYLNGKGWQYTLCI